VVDDANPVSFADIDAKNYYDGLARKFAVGIRCHGSDAPHVFTKWSRSQLLAHLGTREKWFDHVSIDTQADELNTRRSSLNGFMVRTMKSFDHDDLRIVRGIVSSSYADIPDTDIMRALREVLPNGDALSYSGKTDRAFYAYVLSEDMIRIPGTSFEGYPGMLVRNSEVGFTSLWVIPTLTVVGWSYPIILQRDPLLRKVHRGSFDELRTSFDDALGKARIYWRPMEEKLNKLYSITYATEDEAINQVVTLLSRAGAMKGMIQQCCTAYRNARHSFHTAYCIFAAVLEVASSHANQDASYIGATVAGAVLYGLIG
jgi:hypothetical protein